MRAARALTRLDEVELGDHVCWRMDPTATLLTDVRAYVADGALYGDKVVMIGSTGAATTARDCSPAASVILDLPDLADTDVMLAAVRREARTAVRQGFRSVRVLTERAPMTAPGGAEEMLAQELKLDEFASESGAIVVCAFRSSLWDAPSMERAACMHPHEMGTRAERPAFRMFSTGANEWSVDGVIDSEGADAFNAAARAAIRHTPTMKLRFDTLEMIDAAGMHALVDAARHLPDRRIEVEGANETVRLCWELAGYATDGVPVVMAA
ncbi:MEDS domain-containing protein [Streptomyces sp. Isolate_45]|uniref:MEDS domain-containing protein n=1 Tax=Streptomyces sp. Isolate_45 TaxID=2950111 RepID=UPI002481AA32|nr:MEDS domain-containing protein [Streptomyces sp. Isolate_45]MDA5279755.1 MEDS domain-containing protein [Streptomyces sp. Isolate_45]MDX2391472.1 MEDS domain-containing protein [Streptomyces sp. DK15]